MRTTFTFSHKVHCCHSQKDGKRLKSATPQGLFSSPFSSHSFPSPPSSSDPSLPSKELLRAPPLGFPWSRGLELRTPPSWEEKLVALEVGHGGLVHSDVDWMGPPGKREKREEEREENILCLTRFLMLNISLHYLCSHNHHLAPLFLPSPALISLALRPDIPFAIFPNLISFCTIPKYYLFLYYD